MSASADRQPTLTTSQGRAAAFRQGGCRQERTSGSLNGSGGLTAGGAADAATQAPPAPIGSHGGYVYFVS